jgi:hypothetical protein
MAIQVARLVPGAPEPEVRGTDSFPNRIDARSVDCGPKTPCAAPDIGRCLRPRGSVIAEDE